MLASDFGLGGASRVRPNMAKGDTDRRLSSVFGSFSIESGAAPRQDFRARWLEVK